MRETEAIRRIYFHEGLALGLFVAALTSGGVFGLTKNFNLDQETYSDLFIGCMAILAAFLSVRSIRLQMQQEREVIREKQIQRLSGNRSRLGFALHDLCNVFTECTKQIWKPVKDYRLDSRRILEACTVVSSCIEDETPETAQNLAEIMSRAQVLCARHQPLLESTRLEEVAMDIDLLTAENVLVSRSEAISQLFEFVNVCESAFNYARLKVDLFEVPQNIEHDLKIKFQIRVDEYAERHPLWPTVVERFSI